MTHRTILLLSRGKTKTLQKKKNQTNKKGLFWLVPLPPLPSPPPPCRLRATASASSLLRTTGHRGLSSIWFGLAPGLYFYAPQVSPCLLLFNAESRPRSHPALGLAGRQSRGAGTPRSTAPRGELPAKRCGQGGAGSVLQPCPRCPCARCHQARRPWCPRWWLSPNPISRRAVITAESQLRSPKK